MLLIILIFLNLILSDTYKYNEYKFNYYLSSKTADSKHRVFLPIYSSSLQLKDVQTCIRSAIIIQHGLSANADDYFAETLSATGDRISDVIIISPLFGSEHLNGSQWQQGGNGSDVALSFSGNSCWMDGCDNKGSAANFASSFDAYDQMLLFLMDRYYFPNMSLITLAGFSAGAQFLNRYSWATSLQYPQKLVQFIISDAGTYLYLSDERPDKSCRPLNTSNVMPCKVYNVPNVASCIGYNYYKYGLTRLPVDKYQYFSKFSNINLTNQHTADLINKNLRFIFGAQDICNCNQAGNNTVLTQH